MADTHQRPGPGSPAPMGRDDIAGLLAGHLGQRRPPAEPPPGPAPSAPAGGGPAPAGPSSAPRLAGLPGAIPVGWDVIEDLQAVVSKQLSDNDPDKLLEEADRRALAKSLVRTAVADWAAKYAQGNPRSPTTRRPQSAPRSSTRCTGAGACSRCSTRKASRT